MPFNFNFTFQLPGPAAPNPFAASEAPRGTSEYSGASEWVRSDTRPRRRRPSPTSTAHSPSPAPINRKRGWVPAFAEPSQATSSATSNGYLDTPAKYRGMVPAPSARHEAEEMDDELPAPKRRRTLVGSVISTALSAALIGTAVGLTVYRLWRDRGRDPELLPPPPYQQGDWVPVRSESESKSSGSAPTRAAPPTPRSKRTRHTVTRAAGTRHRKTRSLAHTLTPPRGASPAGPSRVQPEFDFEGARAAEEPEEDDQMDWLGDKIARLIEDGKKALGREVVVMSEAPEDEVDDATGDWEEEDARAGPSTLTPSGSLRGRRARPQSLQRAPQPPSYPGTPQPSASPRVAHFGARASGAGAALRVPEVMVTPSSSARAGEHEWESPDVREFMERARAARAAARR